MGYNVVSPLAWCRGVEQPGEGKRSVSVKNYYVKKISMDQEGVSKEVGCIIVEAFSSEEANKKIAEMAEGLSKLDLGGNAYVLPSAPLMGPVPTKQKAASA